VLWKAELGDEFSRCPVVTADRVLYGCRGGSLVVLNRADGKAAWSKKVESRFGYEPVPLGDKVLFFNRQKAILANLADGLETPLRYIASPKQGPKDKLDPKDLVLGEEPLLPIAYYKGNLYIVERHADKGHEIRQVNAIWDVHSGSIQILTPAPAETTGKGKP
jgi:hypothetical protein